MEKEPAATKRNLLSRTGGDTPVRRIGLDSRASVKNYSCISGCRRRASVASTSPKPVRFKRISSLRGTQPSAFPIAVSQRTSLFLDPNDPTTVIRRNLVPSAADQSRRSVLRDCSPSMVAGALLIPQKRTTECQPRGSIQNSIPIASTLMLPRLGFDLASVVAVYSLASIGNEIPTAWNGHVVAPKR